MRYCPETPATAGLLTYLHCFAYIYKKNKEINMLKKGNDCLRFCFMLTTLFPQVLYEQHQQKMCDMKNGLIWIFLIKALTLFNQHI